MFDLKRQRVRDPLHNLIEFDEGDPFERMLWRVVKTAPFQRLRRIRQLGFSDFVYPGATHSRFIHSLGVFHTARQLMRIVRRHVPDQPGEHINAEAALAAALVHDVGHGPFSHAFEPLGKHLGWKLVGEHENHSEALIRSTESGAIGAILNGYGHEGFAGMVADIVRGGPATVYRSVVSSQFDADRLDYVRRDRLMSGTQLAGVDFEWLIANLEIGELQPDSTGVRRQTFVLGPKAIYAAESFVTGVFQMYPTVYLHKTTRGAEKLAQAMLQRVAELVADGHVTASGLPENHPLTKLFKEPENLTVLSDLDDSVVLGALPLLRQSDDSLVKNFAARLQTRRLFKAMDLGPSIIEATVDQSGRHDERAFLRMQEKMTERIEEWLLQPDRRGRILLDSAIRKPYKPIEEEGPMNQIWIRDGGKLVDIRDRSPAVAATGVFRAFRAYVAKEDDEARSFVSETASCTIKGG
ncbi:MAG: HD domain-containing protein [Pseudorhodoplanes sp.]